MKIKNKISEMDYKIEGIWIDNKFYAHEFYSIRELESFLIGFFYGVNKNEL